MTKKLKHYQVLDVLCGGTFYKVRHKVTGKIFAWKAYDCSGYSDEQIQNISSDVHKISQVESDNLLKFYDTILHEPSKTLYFVLEYSAGQSVEELLATCEATDKLVSEDFIWYVVRELARALQAAAAVPLVALRAGVSAAAVLLGDAGRLRVDCFQPAAAAEPGLRGAGAVLRALCAAAGPRCSDELRALAELLCSPRGAALPPAALLRHPAVLAHLDAAPAPRRLADVLVPAHHAPTDSNKCDSEKAVQLRRAVEPAPRKPAVDSPIYCNISPVRAPLAEATSPRGCMSPTLAALALELPGFVPRSRRLGTATSARQVSDDVFSEQWMSRLVALRRREESLNQRERDLLAKEIASSPGGELVPRRPGEDSDEEGAACNGITLPVLVPQLGRPRRRAGSARRRPRRKSYAYEELDSSLSANAGDASLVQTAARLPAHVRLPPVDRAAGVTLTFYELEHVDRDGYQLPRSLDTDISRFKYLDLEKLSTEKRSALWSHSSPSKQQKVSSAVFNDITNHGIMRKTPSKTSLTSKVSDTSRFSMASTKSAWSMESCKLSDSNVSNRTRSSVRMSLAPVSAMPEVKKPKSRKSLIPFKTPFKFRTSTKV